MARILAIDDDEDLLALISRALVKDQHAVTVRTSGDDVRPADLTACDLILLDVMMPGKDGFTFLREHRAVIDAPVLFLTAKDFEQDKLEGFASGGDDYITKPFSVKELRARVNAHLRREHREKRVRLADGPVSCDLVSRTFFVNDAPVPLTASEFELCLLLLKHKGQVFSKEDIYVTVYGYDAEGDSRFTITERVKQIRQKFKQQEINPIQTVWGIGYKWENER